MFLINYFRLLGVYSLTSYLFLSINKSSILLRCKYQLSTTIHLVFTWRYNLVILYVSTLLSIIWWMIFEIEIGLISGNNTAFLTLVQMYCFIQTEMHLMQPQQIRCSFSYSYYITNNFITHCKLTRLSWILNLV